VRAESNCHYKINKAVSSSIMITSSCTYVYISNVKIDYAFILIFFINLTKINI